VKKVIVAFKEGAAAIHVQIQAFHIYLEIVIEYGTARIGMEAAHAALEATRAEWITATKAMTTLKVKRSHEYQ
jgi:hypothetical protein